MTVEQISAALARPFDPPEVEWKPQTIMGDRALAVAYVDARCVMDRLDAVFGVDGWQDAYDVLGDGNVVCSLTCRFSDGHVTKCDVGGESDQKDEGDRRKASFSDALKRAAVKFGVGRYLYRLPPQWVGWDAQKKAFSRQPELPAAFLPDYAADLARCRTKAELVVVGRRIRDAGLPEPVRKALTEAYRKALVRLEPPAPPGETPGDAAEPEPEAAGASA